MQESQKQAACQNQSAVSASELEEPIWSVVSFERREASGLTLAQAVQKLSELESAKVAGLCIVTDDAAARIDTPKA